ncbi:hypothetical protein BDR26DRAFT_933665 [Obelidium mucronatum]|nr:hypothetical protein BDR26DRAFT_933665 [Obelidium mucronatum]
MDNKHTLPLQHSQTPIEACFVSSLCLLVVDAETQTVLSLTNSARSLLLSPLSLPDSDEGFKGLLVEKLVKPLDSLHFGPENLKLGLGPGLATLHPSRRTVLACRHSLSNDDSKVFLDESVIGTGVGVAVDVWVFQDVSCTFLVAKSVETAESWTSQRVWDSLVLVSKDCNFEGKRQRTQSEPPQSRKALPNNQSKTSFSQKFSSPLDTFIVSAERTLVSAAGIIGLSSVPKWLFSQLRDRALIPNPLATRLPFSSKRTTTLPKNTLPEPRPPTLVIKITAFGSIRQACALNSSATTTNTLFLGENPYTLLNRYIMRCVYVKDVARLCSGLAKGVREDRGAEVHVRWDWRSKCETSDPMPDDSENEDNDAYDSQNGSEYEESEESRDDNRDSDGKLTMPRMKWGARDCDDGGLSASTLEEEDRCMSEYQSQQPTRRPSLVEPRRMPPNTSIPTISSNPGDTSSDSPAQSEEPRLIWVRILIIKSSLLACTERELVGHDDDDDDDERDGSLVCIVTAIPDIQSKNWPKDSDISDSTRGRVSLDHESGPWAF